MVTVPDASARTWSRSEGALFPHDPRYAARLLDAYRAQGDALVAAGVRHVVWIVPPHPSSRWLGTVNHLLPDEDWAVYVGAVLDEEQRHPGVVVATRLDQWVATHEPPDGSMRADGLHLTPSGAATVAADFLGPLVVQMGRS